MSPLQLIVFRAALFLTGWIPGVSGLLRKCLIWVVVKKSKSPYGASSKFFTPEDLK